MLLAKYEVLDSSSFYLMVIKSRLALLSSIPGHAQSVTGKNETTHIAVNTVIYTYIYIFFTQAILNRKKLLDRNLRNRKKLFGCTSSVKGNLLGHNLFHYLTAD